MREVTSRDGLGAGIVGLGVMYMVYPYAASEMAPDASLLVFELNDEFYDSLNTRINDPRVTIIHDSAEHLEKYIHDGKKENRCCCFITATNGISRNC